MTRSYCQNHISAYAPEDANCRDCDVQREDEIEWTRMRDEAIRERDEALALAKERGGELALCWCVATDSSPDDAPNPFPGGMAYKAVDAMQDREYAAEARALKAEAERDAAIRGRDEAEEFWRSRDTRSQLAIVDAIRERDAAQRMVAEMQDLLECWNPCGCRHPACNFCVDDKRVARLLQKVLDQP